VELLHRILPILPILLPLRAGDCCVAKVENWRTGRLWQSGRKGKLGSTLRPVEKANWGPARTLIDMFWALEWTTSSAWRSSVWDWCSSGCLFRLAGAQICRRPEQLGSRWRGGPVELRARESLLAQEVVFVQRQSLAGSRVVRGGRGEAQAEDQAEKQEEPIEGC